MHFLGLVKHRQQSHLDQCVAGVQAARVPLNEYEFPASKLANVQAQLERLVEKNYYLHQSAREAYRSFLLSYNSHQLKAIFNVHRLDLAAVARSFGFSAPPKACHQPPSPQPTPGPPAHTSAIYLPAATWPTSPALIVGITMPSCPSAGAPFLKQ